MLNYEIAVIGAGHAGIEASLAASKLNKKVAIFTMSLDSVGLCPCNPSIGGTAKGHLVREIDALGGFMGKVADKASVQSKMLNRGKGPAVHSLRAQIDRKKYSHLCKYELEKDENIDLIQEEIVSIEKENDTFVLTSASNIKYKSICVIVATGTYLNALIHIGEYNRRCGPDNLASANSLTESIKKLSMPIKRFKTGTPARIKRSSINFDALDVEFGDTKASAMSFSNDEIKNILPCYIAYTNENVHKIIKENLHRSPMYSGVIEGIGPRYCPSIEDKIVRFAEKERHQIFVEPCGINNEEMYLAGVSSSLPADVQDKFYHAIKGFENAKIMRYAYAIEYDAIDSNYLYHTLESKKIENLFFAGQVNGSSGYEEAAAQGLIAGINASLKIDKKEAFILDRASSYIGTLIDDLCTNEITDPYRMMTSRSEFRLILRQDNADERLTKFGYNLGLISEDEYQKFEAKMAKKEEEINRLKKVIIKADDINKKLESLNESPISANTSFFDLLKRPNISYDDLAIYDDIAKNMDEKIKEIVEINIKYDGYIKKQLAKQASNKKLENFSLSQDIDYSLITTLRLEAREKLNKIKPSSLAEAFRIAGVSPADIEVLMIYLKKDGYNG